MAQPPSYDRQFSFTDYQTEHPADPLPGASVDIEYNAIKQTLDQLLANLALIQRDDGALANDSVGIDQIKPEVTLGLNAVADWAVGIAYQPNNGVWINGILYRCLIAHTSTVFATDLTAGRWSVIVDVAAEVTAIATPLIEEAISVATEDGLSLAKASNLSDLTSVSTARTNLGLGTAATIDSSTILLKAGNLSGLGSASTARTNLGLGTAAVLSAGAVLQAANNLSDVASASTARTNLGLGTAAVQNVAAFLTPANNLQDVASTSTARANLGLGSAAVLAASAVLQAANNLSDLASAGTARTNLGLGTAAVLNAGTSANNLVQLDGSAKLPAVDGSALTNVGGRLLAVQVFTGSGTWTKPAGTNSVQVEVVGGGGGGGAAGATGGTGGTSSFGAHCSATGGGGGTGNGSTAGGVGGSGSGGTLNVQGQGGFGGDGGNGGSSLKGFAVNDAAVDGTPGQAYGGGGRGSNTSTGGGGGGGGGYSYKYATSALGSTETVTVGAGGADSGGGATNGGAAGIVIVKSYA